MGELYLYNYIYLWFICIYCKHSVCVYIGQGYKLAYMEAPFIFMQLGYMRNLCLFTLRAQC